MKLSKENERIWQSRNWHQHPERPKGVRGFIWLDADGHYWMHVDFFDIRCNDSWGKETREAEDEAMIARITANPDLSLLAR